MRIAFSGIIIGLILLGLSACSAPVVVKEGAVAQPVLEDGVSNELESDCISTITGPDDGIGGTGCQVN